MKPLVEVNRLWSKRLTPPISEVNKWGTGCPGLHSRASCEVMLGWGQPKWQLLFSNTLKHQEWLYNLTVAPHPLPFFSFAGLSHSKIRAQRKKGGGNHPDRLTLTLFHCAPMKKGAFWSAGNREVIGSDMVTSSPISSESVHLEEGKHYPESTEGQLKVLLDKLFPTLQVYLILPASCRDTVKDRMWMLKTGWVSWEITTFASNFFCYGKIREVGTWSCLLNTIPPLRFRSVTLGLCIRSPFFPQDQNQMITRRLKGEQELHVNWMSCTVFKKRNLLRKDVQPDSACKNLHIFHRCYSSHVRTVSHFCKILCKKNPQPLEKSLWLEPNVGLIQTLQSNRVQKHEQLMRLPNLSDVSHLKHPGLVSSVVSSGRETLQQINKYEL